MKKINWDPEKNLKLKRERGVCFEGILFSLEQGLLLDKISHPNQEKYKNQKILIINVDDYAYLIPYVETDEEIFLKTIIPSRKATKKYLIGDENEN